MPETIEDETQKVARWRENIALREGANPEVASLVAENPQVDLTEWVNLVKRGCDPETAFRILAPL